MTVKKKLVPILHFPEFEENWETKKLGKLIEVISGIALKGDAISEGKGSLRILRGINITEGYIRHNDKIDRYYHGDISSIKKFLVKEGDIVLGMDGSKVGKNVSLIDGTDANSVLIQRVARIRNNINSDANFIFQIIYSKYFRKYVDVVNTSSGIPHISLNQIKEFKFAFPSLTEQKKIANFLTAIDNRIQQLTCKIELLEQYKKGVMQQIFSQKNRFKDDTGKAFPDWEEKKLGKTAKIYDGTHQTPKYVENGIPFYSVEHLTANQFTNTKYISKEVYEKENKRVKLEKEDILMTRIGSIGKAKYINWDVRASFYVSLALIKKNKSFDSKYLSQFIESIFFQKELWKRTIHVAFPQKINLGEIGNCKVKLPSLAEQQKIANFLTAIDEKISFSKEQLDKMKTYKRGLLQQMFV